MPLSFQSFNNKGAIPTYNRMKINSDLINRDTKAKSMTIAWILCLPVSAKM